MCVQAILRKAQRLMNNLRLCCFVPTLASCPLHRSWRLNCIAQVDSGCRRVYKSLSNPHKSLVSHLWFVDASVDILLSTEGPGSAGLYENFPNPS